MISSKKNKESVQKTHIESNFEIILCEFLCFLRQINFFNKYESIGYFFIII